MPSSGIQTDIAHFLIIKSETSRANPIQGQFLLLGLCALLGHTCT